MKKGLKKMLACALAVMMLVCSVPVSGFVGLDLGFTASAATIPDDVVSLNGHLYYIYKNMSSWSYAVNYANNLGGYLAVISSEEENNFLYNYVTDLGYNGAYFGYTDCVKEGTWAWVDGETSTYENWSPGEANSQNDSEDYAMFYYKSEAGKWNDGDFTDSDPNDPLAIIVEWVCPHKETDGDNRCDWCDLPMYEIGINETITIDVVAGRTTLIKFVPEKTGYYYFYSSDSKDTYGYLYDENFNEITHDDDGGDSTNFSVYYQLTAGKTYYYGAKYYSSSNSGYYDVTLECDHSFSSWSTTISPTCLTDGVQKRTCSICGKSENETVTALGHSYSSWEKVDDTNHKRTCTRTRCTVSETATHTWNSGVVTTAATCTTAGVKTYTCSICNGTKTETIAKLGHSYGSWIKVDNTNHKRSCTRSGCTASETATHTWNSGVVTTAATCTTAGVKTYTCSVCNGTKTETITKLGHSYGSWTKVDNANHKRSCTRSGCTASETATHAWNSGVVTTAATCTTAGVKTYTCSVCNGTKTETIIKLGHDMGESVVVKEVTCTENGEIRSYCSRCDFYASSEVKASHQYTSKVVAPTCTQEGYTLYVCHCGAFYKLNEVSSLGHAMGTWIETVAPTCTEKGEERSDCSRCDYYETREIDAKGHEDNDNDGYCDDEDCKENICEHTDVTLISKKEATCTVGGYTGDKVCDKCGVTTETGTATNALGHAMGEWTETKAPTCTEKGEERSDCSRCDYYETREIDAKGHEDNDNDGYCDDEDCKENICTHENVTLTGKKEATCTVGGYTGDKVCDKCGVTTETGTATKALGHAMGEWTETKAPTCTEKGEERSDCSRCDYYEAREVAATGHNDEDDDGYCDDEDCKENICEHTDTTLIGKADATCTANGYTGDKVCDKCGVTTETGTATNALGHAMSEWVETVAPTCTEKGEERSDCSRCDYYETREVAEKGHEDNDNDGYCDDGDCKENICEHTDVTLTGKKEATCTVGGYTGDKVCDKCGVTTETGTVTNALGHNLGEWIETKAPTCTEKGEERSDCSRCDYYETREVAATGHNDEDNDGYCDDEDCKENICSHENVTLTGKKEATCTANGYTGDKVCDKCGVTTETGTVTNALGHAMSEWVETIAPTCTKKGEERSDCSRCDYYETREVASTGHKDENNDGKCDDCDENVCKHEDKDADGKCDGCGGDYSQISKKCLCFCHSTNIFIRIIYIICRLIFKIFNVHRICACGQYHF